MSKSTLQKIVEDEFPVRSYSGRYMYNESCLGIVLDRYGTIGDLFAHVLEQVESLDDADEIADDFRNMKMDDLGKGSIIYFPSIKYSEEADEEEDDGVI